MGNPSCLCPLAYSHPMKEPPFHGTAPALTYSRSVVVTGLHRTSESHAYQMLHGSIMDTHPVRTMLGGLKDKLSLLNSFLII